ncbi:hypothetical protein KR222_008756 [Zaprionus bogoriensis]|nr:hypothetical protein KR222_008756 [Zaprionus bogoriensis]
MDTEPFKVAPTTGATPTSSDKMNYALQVALQTMKERCTQLQRRLSCMEEENRRAYSNNSNQGQPDCDNDVVSLRAQVQDLHRQREQLEDQINMVSDENRRLWSRLSEISKDHAQLAKEDDLTFKSQARGTANGAIGGNQNLIRSKTFTQHSPNPLLRQKLKTDTSTEQPNASDELSFRNELQVVDELDNSADAENCMEGLQELRREALKQQQGLNSVITQLKARNAVQPCPNCAQNAGKKPEMADKSLETEERLSGELKRYQNESTASQVPESNKEHATLTTLTMARLNIIQEKQKADAAEKTCPMCGKLFSSQVSFKAFQEHVETHFIDESLDIDGSMDRQFEFISQAVGDF